MGQLRAHQQCWHAWTVRPCLRVCLSPRISRSQLRARPPSPLCWPCTQSCSWHLLTWHCRVLTLTALGSLSPCSSVPCTTEQLLSAPVCAQALRFSPHVRELRWAALVHMWLLCSGSTLLTCAINEACL